MSKLTDKLNKSIESRTVLTDAASVGLMACGFGDKYLVGLNSMYKEYKWVQKKMLPAYKEIEAKFESCGRSAAKSDVAPSHTAWVCWFQGIESAPEVVKNCYASLKKWLTDWNIILITSENYADYASLPDFVVQKWQRGLISNTHFSDILRLQLLVGHGGLWLDATTMLTGKIPTYVLHGDLFVFHNGWLDQEMINMASWFIYSARPQNRLLVETLNLLYAYWEKYSYIKNYFLMHILFRIVSDHNPDLWEAIPYFNQIDNHLLMNELQKPFDPKRIEQIKALTPIHKLTYKLPKCDSDSTLAYIKEIY